MADKTDQADPPSPITISEDEFDADHKKYMDLATGDGQVFVNNAEGVTILILGHGPLSPVPDDWPDPVDEMPSGDCPEAPPGLGWLD